METSSKQITKENQEAVVLMARLIAHHLYEREKQKKAKKPKNTNKNHDKTI